MSVWPSDSGASHTREVRGRLVPSRLFGYDVIDLIGEGARSTIYAVTHPESKQLYALKHVHRQVDKDSRFIEQLENEYYVGKQLNHHNLRKVIDCKTNRNLLLKISEAALIMELFDGQPLEENLPRSMSKVVETFIEAAKALESMHAAGFVHCDFKPNNVLRAPGGAVKVIDLGQACPVGTVKKRIQGTPDYISPEQVKCKPVSKQTDVFNFGASLYWALSGRKLPTLFTTRKEKNSFIVDDQLASPMSLNPLVPETLSNFVMECVRTRASKRPTDMGVVAARLETILQAVKRSEGTAPPMPDQRQEHPNERTGEFILT